MEATPIPETIDQVFRRESGRLISVLTRLLGPQNLELAEDVLQDAFVSAVREWSANGIPDNPPAWLLTAARRRAIDAIRRERTRRTFADLGQTLAENFDVEPLAHGTSFLTQILEDEDVQHP